MKKQRYRIEFSKTESMRYTGHLDLILTWERTFRRAGLPLSYSEGFNARPVINLASPLPLGFISSAELGDFWLSNPITSDEFEQSLQKALPPGLEINAIEELEEIHGPKLPSQVISSTYSVELFHPEPELSQKVEQILQSDSIIRKNKRGKEYDLRPLILDLVLSENNDQTQFLQIKLVTQPNQTGRPDEVLLALEIPPSETRITRTKIHLQAGGKS
jgi:radical SAM-linked protein